MAKLNRREYDRSRAKTILTMRGVLLILGIGLMGCFELPWGRICLRLANGEKPIAVVGTILKNDSGYRGTFFLSQSLTVSTKSGGTGEYTLLYCTRVFGYGQEYALTVMPGSNFVLQVQDPDQ